MSPNAPTLATPRRLLLLAARVAWVAIAATTLLGAFASSVPARYAELAHPSENVGEALAELGLSATAYALYNVALDTIFVSVFAVIAIIIFWRRSGDPIALLVATMLVVWGPLNGLFVLTPGSTDGMYGPLQAILGTVLTYVGYITWMLFFYLFPSGRFVPGWTRWLALLYGVFFFGLWTFTPYGPESWTEDGLASFPTGSFADLEQVRRHRAVVVLDVRRIDEHDQARITGSLNIPIHELPHRVGEVPQGEVWVHCASGYRASIAASILDAAGHRLVAIDDEFENAEKVGLDLVGSAA